LIPGHELIGKVTAVGADVKDVKLGDRVGVSPVSRSCNDCEQCNADHCQLCPKKVLTYNGTYKGRQTFGVGCIHEEKYRFIKKKTHK
jgi:D-arabinose 1-dehydrogenase-like Zn-dependent alcohol dehydrogenase